MLYSYCKYKSFPVRRECMKCIIKIIVTLGVLGLLFACAPGSVQISADDAAALELTELRSLLSGVDASLGLLVDDSQSARTLSRAITPGDADPDLAGKTPSEIYSEYGGSGEVRVPSEGYFQDYYNQGEEAYFTMSEDGAHYRIKLYMYPSVNFDIKYNYEEYLVATNDWTNMNDAFETGKLSKYETYFSDGSVAKREIIETSITTGVYYTSFGVSDDILGSGEYDYPSTIPAPGTTGSGEWSSRTDSTIDIRGPYDLSAVEYYTENTTTTYSGISYMATEGNSRRAGNTVLRFSGDTTTGASKVRSLSTIGSRFTLTTAVDISLDANKIVYNKVLKLWHAAPGSADDSKISHEERTYLMETGVDTNLYTGYTEVYRRGRATGKKHLVSLTRKTDGSYKLTRAKGISNTRAVDSDSELELVLTKLKDFDVVFVNIPMGSGRFYGIYEHGAFIGVYSSGNGQDYSASVDQFGVNIDGIDYSYDELY